MAPKPVLIHARRLAYVRLAATIISIAFLVCGGVAHAAAGGQGDGGSSDQPSHSKLANPATRLLNQVAFDQHLDAQLPLDATFTDQTGRTVHLGDFFHDRPVILELGYYNCPMLCPTVTAGLTRALCKVPLKSGKDYQVVMISIDPHETVLDARVKKRASLIRFDNLHAKGWHFLVGQDSQIHAVTDAVGFKYGYDPTTKTYAHAAGFVIVTPSGQVSKYFYGITYDPDTLKLSLVQASQGQIGSLVDQLILACCIYDPNTGHYKWAIWTIIRVAGILTVLVIAAGIAIALLHERRKAKKLLAVSP